MQRGLACKVVALDVGKALLALEFDPNCVCSLQGDPTSQKATVWGWVRGKGGWGGIEAGEHAFEVFSLMGGSCLAHGVGGGVGRGCLWGLCAGKCTAGLCLSGSREAR